MNWREHQAGGALFGTTLAALMTTNQLVQAHPTTILLPIFASSFAAMLPDLDKQGTHASHLMPRLANKLGQIGHRTILHSIVIPTINLLLVTILAFICSYFSSLLAAIILTSGYGCSAGWYSHLVYDIITPMGCPLLAPFISDRWSIYHFNNVKDAKKILIVTIVLEIIPLLTVIHFLGINLFNFI